MSNALPYLQKLRKSQLADFAEATDLHNYEEYNKPELASALDEHLQANRSIFAKQDQLAEYYKRLSATPRRSSPIKREPKTDTPASDAPRSARRRQTKAKEEVEPTDESDADALQTPFRPMVAIRPTLPPSPAVVTDAIDRQTAVWRKSVTDAWTGSGVQEQSNALRATLSSVKAVEVLVLALEAYGLIRQILPLRYLATIPPVAVLHTPELAVKVPDLFVLLDGSFWAPFSLWLLTSVVVPLTAAYFFNLSLAHTGSGPAAHTRRSRAAQTTFDPLSFNITKALVSYLVYANRFTFWHLYSTYSVAKVNAAVPGHWAGMLTGSAIGVIGTLYEAILRK
ncbi:conserved hypothetical protein [Aspergillus terreus NIH2624]|jgi:hypothetical protein|uniref:Uncharacterized protein n=1 Tax=Aspergillus terreus (strain NIH 2624 / FGSC A1156) TaxID=341663 RepID=Q0CIR7_ASPTN|nr:uncharacterized protein ATEG_06417 [Aspergillus terreus NIH2624]EAU32961.1 conserved hypothetical protein [Aspergillus terreus NIH2624]